jgi:putative spermidine/putrescine transport system ATP-binding protein
MVSMSLPNSATPEVVGDPPTVGQPTALAVTGVSKTLGGRPIITELDLEVRAGELVCLLGPSGCGKTTTLRMIGGFVQPDAGRILINGRDVTGSPPERRPTAMVFQNYALWPHMTVFNNIAFGLKLRKIPKAEVVERVEKVLELVKLTHHIHSHPARISGGEQQRVALARALVLEPDVLLLDEPLSNLDAKLRVKVRDDIREIQQRVGITTVFVTHDQDEAMSISDRIAVMNSGRIEQYADAQTLYTLPRTRFVADFIGAMNVLSGTPGAGELILANGAAVPCEQSTEPTAENVEICVRPEDVRLSPDGPGPKVSVVRDIPRGHYKEVVLDLAGTEIRAFVPPGFTAPQAHVTFARALVYRDGHLVPSTATATSK